MSGSFGYDNSDSELKEVAEKIKKLSTTVAVVHAVLNNNYQDPAAQHTHLAGFLEIVDPDTTSAHSDQASPILAN